MGYPDAPVHRQPVQVDRFHALGLDRGAMHAAHAPGALWKHDTSEPRTPLLKRVPVGPPKRANLSKRRAS